MQVGVWQLGLILLPKEAELFEESDVAPMWGVGIRGRSRPRPAEVYFLQMKVLDCPHIRPDNTCAIYSQRPLVCRGHPLSISINPFSGMPDKASVDSRCAGTREVASTSPVNIKAYFSKDIVQASVDGSLYLSGMFKEAAGRAVWLYDLKTQKWIMLTKLNAASLQHAQNTLYIPWKLDDGRG